jgi:hypothetical protein
MIDWLNPSDDILDARSIGFAEGQQSRDEEVEALTAERDALAAELARLRRLEEAAITMYYTNHGSPEWGTAYNMLMEAIDEREEAEKAREA